MDISKTDMLQFVGFMHDMAIMAKRGRLTENAINDQFEIIRENVNKWEEEEIEQ